MLFTAIFMSVFLVTFVGLLLLIRSGFAEVDRRVKAKSAEAKRNGWYGYKKTNRY